jgi:hypothetical protein
MELCAYDCITSCGPFHGLKHSHEAPGADAGFVASLPGCALIAMKLACSSNPAVAFQLLAGKCVVHRQALFTSIGHPVEEFIAALSSMDVPRFSAEFGSNRTVYFHPNPTCTHNPGSVASPCVEEAAAATCTGNPVEKCYFDLSCKDGGLGCEAAGWSSCRFCGFGIYESVGCPGTDEDVATHQANLVQTNVEVTEACPRACDSHKTHTCYYDPHCSEPLSPHWHGGLGCGAGGKPNCRSCGFALSAKDAEEHAGKEYLAGDAHDRYLECRPAETEAIDLFEKINSALGTATVVTPQNTQASRGSRRAEACATRALIFIERVRRRHTALTGPRGKKSRFLLRREISSSDLPKAKQKPTLHSHTRNSSRKFLHSTYEREQSLSRWV